jgi:uncharacterized membrane protein
MGAEDYPLHHRSEVVVAASADAVFAALDDHRRLANHMEKPSLMTAGASMRIETDSLGGRVVGSVIRMTGRVLGINVALDEVVTERTPPRRKVWETVGEPRLLVIGAYRMGFEIAPQGDSARLAVFIDYRLPTRGLTRALGLLFGSSYAAWCTRRMADDAKAASYASAKRTGHR